MILPHMTIAVMNLDQYNSMTDSDKAWFDSYMQEVTEDFNAMGTQDNYDGWEQVIEAGAEKVEFNQELYDDLRAVAQTSSWVDIRQDIGDDIVDYYLDKIAQIEGS
jgi:TRAP-type C4-dicarboxylate transport system substrate-binding protein